VGNQLYSLPYITCADVLLYRSNNLALRNAKGLDAILDVLGICANPNEIWPAPGKGILIDFSKPTTSALYYLQGVNAVKNSYPLYPPLPPAKNSLDQQTLANLLIYTQMAGYSQVRFVDKKSDRLDRFKAGIGACMAGVTELASFFETDQMNNYALRLLPYANQELAQLYVDSFGISSRISAEREELAIDFINLATQDDVLYECLGKYQDEGYLNPQYLIPAKRAVMEAFVKDYRFYQYIAMLVEGKVSPICLDADAYNWLLSPVPTDIRNAIGGPLTTEDLFDMTMVSNDPSAPTNLVNKW
jgi:thiamine pyridinylase